MKCEICGKEYTSNISGALTNHIINTHNMTMQKYYDKYILKNNEDICKCCGKKSHFISLSQGYRKYCLICKPIKQINLSCKICNTLFKSVRSLSKHLKYIHNLTSQEYYDKYEKQENEGICKVCEKITPFLALDKGYQLHCSSKCARIDPNVVSKLINTMQDKYGVDYMVLDKDVQEKAQINSHTKEAIQKQQKTNLKKYGYKAFNRTKTKQTKLERYGDENYVNPKKIIESHAKRTKQEKEHTKNKIKQTQLNKYGGIGFASPELLAKVKETNFKKYGAENVYASEYGKQKLKDTIENNKELDNKLSNEDL